MDIHVLLRMTFVLTFVDIRILATSIVKGEADLFFAQCVL